MKTIEYAIINGLTAYPDAVAAMEQRVAGIIQGMAAETLWFLEHPPLYTAGTSAKASDLLDNAGFPVYATGRGGQYTYHGPGQRVVYIMLNLHHHGQDIRAYICKLEEWLIRTLAVFGLHGERRAGRVGIWLATPEGQESKIAAIGVRVRRWITFHGISFNINPDLSHFEGIIPCGLQNYGVTSLQQCAVPASIAEVDAALCAAFAETFSCQLAQTAALPPEYRSRPAC